MALETGVTLPCHTTPLVSIVVLNWNGLQDTVDCLASLDRITYPNLDWWVVDNGSSDGSSEAIQSQFPTVRLIRNSRNLGFAGGINVGIRAALDNGAAYVFLLNNDTIVAPDVVDRLLDGMCVDSQIGVVVPKIVYHRAPERIWSAGARWATLPPRVKLIGYGKSSDDRHYCEPYFLHYATGCALLVNGRTFARVGLFDECFFMYQEDYDFARRVCKAGLRVYYEPRAIVYHKVSQGLGENSARKWYHWSRSSVLFYRKHFPTIYLVWFALWTVAREVAKANWGILPAFARGFCDGLTSWERTRSGTYGDHGV